METNGSESQEYRETCSRGAKEMPQDLAQAWTGSTRFRKSWGVLSNYETENREHRETCSSDIEQTQPPAGDYLSLDENGGILDLSTQFTARQKVEPW